MTGLAALRGIAKSLALRTLGSRPAAAGKLGWIGRQGVLTIANLHRVAADDGSSYPPLDPGLFEDLLRFVKRHFTIVTFADLETLQPGPKPPLILSFDDGYKDFAQVAAPLMAKHGVRANLNLIPGCIESGLPPLNVHLADFIGRAPPAAIAALRVPGFVMPERIGPRQALGDALSLFLKSKPIAEQKAIGEDLIAQMALQADFAPTPMMSLEEVRQVAAVHEIGAHSFEHANMAAESDDYLRADIARCRAWLDDKLGLPLDIYAFPNGSYRPGQIEILLSAGIRHVLLVDERFSSPGANVHPRITFDARSRHEMRFRATGALAWPKAAA